MHNPRTCKYCGSERMEFVTFNSFAFCDTTCLAYWVQQNPDRENHSILSPLELEEAWGGKGNQRYMDGMRRLNDLYQSAGVPQTPEGIQALRDSDPDAFAIYVARMMNPDPE